MSAVHVIPTPGRPWWRRRIGLLLSAIVVLAAVVRFWALDFGLPHTEARPDENTLIRVARGIINGDPNPHFFNYPSLYLYVLSGLYMAVYAVGRFIGAFPSFEAFDAAWTVQSAGPYLVSRALSATLGTATVPALYLLARRLIDRRTATVAAAFLSLAFLHVRDSHFGVTDPMMTLLVVCAVGLLLKALQEGRPNDFVAAGLVAGLASSTKYNAALLLVPMLVLLGHTAFGAGPLGARRALQHAALLGTPFVLGFLAGTPFAVLDPAAFWKDVTFEMQHMQQGHGPALGPGWLYHLSVSFASGLGWPLLGAALVGLALAARLDRIAAVLVWSFPLVYYAIAGSGRVVFVRYMVPLVPFLCLSAAVFATTATDALTRRLTERRRDLVLAGLCALILVPSAARVAAFDWRLGDRDSRVLAAEWLGSRVAPGAPVYQTGSRYVELRLPVSVDRWWFDEDLRRFETGGSPVDTLPEWIVVHRSPLRYYSQVPEGIDDIVRSCYVLAHAVRALDARAGRVYDQQDAFFLPLVGFAGVRRPGPNIEIYRRAEGVSCAPTGPPGAGPAAR